MSSLADCCPACLDVVPVVPWRVPEASPGGVRADYRCGCGHEWWTCWNPAALAALGATP